MKHLIFGILLLVAPAAALADATGPCKDDAPHICPHKKFGEGEMFECLFNHLEYLSPGCKAHIDALQAYKKACEKEIAANCQGKPFYCLLEMKDAAKKASPVCRKQMRKQKG